MGRTNEDELRREIHAYALAHENVSRNLKRVLFVEVGLMVASFLWTLAEAAYRRDASSLFVAPGQYVKGLLLFTAVTALVYLGARKVLRMKINSAAEEIRAIRKAK